MWRWLAEALIVSLIATAVLLGAYMMRYAWAL